MYFMSESIELILVKIGVAGSSCKVVN